VQRAERSPCQSRPVRFSSRFEHGLGIQRTKRIEVIDRSSLREQGSRIVFRAHLSATHGGQGLRRGEFEQ
jgi:hypothetical protein